MNKQIKKKWIAALRSGQYDQGRGALCTVTEEGAKYCGLGVLYEVVNGEDAWVVTNGLLKIRGGGRRASSMYLGPKGCLKNKATLLASMNDTGKTFDKLATWIEENL